MHFGKPTGNTSITGSWWLATSLQGNSAASIEMSKKARFFFSEVQEGKEEINCIKNMTTTSRKKGVVASKRKTVVSIVTVIEVTTCTTNDTFVETTMIYRRISSMTDNPDEGVDERV